MKKFFKLGKRMMALFIVVLLNINSYAAVSANDGSAFVTKAEFDALVNTFNEQMDTYQSGLNSKIDGAIANYLAGLSGITTEKVQPILNPKYGIWSATTDANSGVKKWIEGTMSYSLEQESARWVPNASGGGAVITTMKMTNGSDFTEHIVRNVSTISGSKYAEYYGYCQSAVDAVLYGMSYGVGDMAVMCNSNTAYINNFRWMAGGIPKGHFYLCRYNYVDSDYWWNCSISNGSVTRTINDELLSDVICTGTSVEFPYFNLYDTAKSNALWCLDEKMDENGLHTLITKVDGLKSDWSGTTRTSSNVQTTKPLSVGNVNNGWMDSITGSTRRSGTNVVRTKPFLGFTKDITDWKQLYTKAYDSYMEDFEKKNANVASVTVKGEKHYMITNGVAMLYAEKGNVVSIPVKFEKINGAWKNIDIWLKASAFKATEDVKTSQDADIIKPVLSECTNMQTSVYSNAVTLNASAGETEADKGQGIIKFTMPKNGYVFMKWSVAGNEGKGGGTYMPQTMTIQKEN